MVLIVVCILSGKCVLTGAACARFYGCMNDLLALHPELMEALSRSLSL